MNFRRAINFALGQCSGSANFTFGTELFFLTRNKRARFARRNRLSKISLGPLYTYDVSVLKNVSAKHVCVLYIYICVFVCMC